MTRVIASWVVVVSLIGLCLWLHQRHSLREPPVERPEDWRLAHRAVRELEGVLRQDRIGVPFLATEDRVRIERVVLDFNNRYELEA